jgi:hypothetical protein
MAKKKLKELTPIEVFKLVNLLKEQYQFQIAQRKHNVLAKYIQFPKTPSILSETIALNLLRQKKILPHLQFISGSRVGNKGAADLRLETAIEPIPVEVKGTADKGFQNLTAKDIQSPYIIWIRFDRLFIDSEVDEIEVLVIKNPTAIFSIETKGRHQISVEDVYKLPDESREVYKFSFKEYCKFTDLLKSVV